jgi:twitching motility protein PilT
MTDSTDLLPVRPANPSLLPVPIETTAVEDEPTKGPDPALHKLLLLTIETGASDLHLTVGRPPSARRDGVLVPYEGEELLDAVTVERMVMSILDETKQDELAADRQVDFSFGLEGIGRFRGNAFRQRGALALALRLVPYRIRSLEELGAPAVASQLLAVPYGLVLVVGPTGSGKSTTLAAMIDRINSTRPCHILTIEDPIEYLHNHKVAMVNQREVGTDVATFPDGLRSALREDPDVILLGEMRDLESISIALTLAETGHLVFATLHTNDAPQALDRIVDVFPAERRDQIQIMLAASLQGVISQRLLPAVAGGRVGAYEVLIANDAVRNLVREGKSRQMRNLITTGGNDGMQTLETDLARLVNAGLVDLDTACGVSLFPNDVRSQMATQRATAGAQATIAAGQSAASANGVATPAPPTSAPPQPSSRWRRG